MVIQHNTGTPRPQNSILRTLDAQQSNDRQYHITQLYSVSTSHFSKAGLPRLYGILYEPIVAEEWYSVDLFNSLFARNRDAYPNWNGRSW
jgi:hypothetical protein